jgi:hypothetical protein
MIGKDNDCSYFYKIILSYEVPYNVLDSTEPEKVQARENLYGKLTKMVPEDEYDKFYVKLCMYQRKDTFNYIITYEAFFRSENGLPMEEYTKADDIKKEAKKELETFFTSLDCDFKQLTIKTLL